MQPRLDPTDAASNTAVLRAACAGDTTAWDEIVHRYEGAIHAAVASYRPAPADAADAIQNTWLRLLEHATAIREPEKLGGWLTTTARREYLALIRRKRTERLFATMDIDQPCAEPTPETMVITAETRRHVRLATNTLSGRPRALIAALYYHPCDSYAEVARHTGMPIVSIGPTRLRTLRRLRRSFTAHLDNS
jgi:RNA polymerase sigma factor (sigma-70 family)